MTTLGITLGGMMVCYSIDGIATLVFPPAGLLSAYCPAAGAAFGGGNAVSQGVNTVAKAL